MAEWISVKKQKPNGNNAIVTTSDGVVGEAFRVGAEYYWMEDLWSWDRASPIYDITHWMPLPEPPEDETYEKENIARE